MAITSQREFAARRLAQQRMLRIGQEVNALAAARRAAKLYADGASVDRAARIAVQQLTGGGQ